MKRTTCHYCHEPITQPTRAQLVLINGSDTNWIAAHDACLNTHEPNDGVFSNVAYWIALSDLNDARELNRWDAHLQAKSWIDRTDWREWRAHFAAEAK